VNTPTFDTTVRVSNFGDTYLSDKCENAFLVAPIPHGTFLGMDGDLATYHVDAIW
jgi:hypothetical protein